MKVNQNLQLEKGRNKQFWTEEEERAVVHGLLELSVGPQWKGKETSRLEYLVKLKSIMNIKFPRSGLKANPHMDSKTKWFRDKYSVLRKMSRTFLVTILFLLINAF